MKVITRFAPSPTGMLHIGGARTALFNYLFAKHCGGEFRLRIEDTDLARNSDAAYLAILDGLKWLGLPIDGEVIYQKDRVARHAEVAAELVAKGQAYRCYMTAEEIAAEREEAKARGKIWQYDRRWRPTASAGKNLVPPVGVQPPIRIKAPLTGALIVRDAVQGEVRFGPDALDDLVILRSDGTPTYNFAVVVDDHDMEITHVIRGDDHLSNAGRQTVIYQAMGWDVPVFAHVPMIHGADGGKLSKRHGATGTTEYAAMGYLPEAMRNYLARLGWGHGDDEIFSDAQAIEWFTLEQIGKAPARLDFAKLNHVNAHYLRAMPNAALAELVTPFLSPTPGGGKITAAQHKLLTAAMDGLKPRAQTLVELANAAKFYITPRPVTLDAKAEEIIANGGKTLLFELLVTLEALPEWNHDSLMEAAKEFAGLVGKKLGDVMAPVRAAITGSTASPSMFEAMAILGRDESLARIKDVLAA